jgi:hypothetical protein
MTTKTPLIIGNLTIGNLTVEAFLLPDGSFELLLDNKPFDFFPKVKVNTSSHQTFKDAFGDKKQ